jgi:hypothetical protein
MREKSAAAMPVRLWAARTVSDIGLSTLRGAGVVAGNS